MVVTGIDADTWAYIALSAVKSSFRLLQIFYNHQLFVMKLFMLSIFPRLFFFFNLFCGTAFIENSYSVSENEVREKCSLSSAEFLRLFYWGAESLHALEWALEIWEGA